MNYLERTAAKFLRKRGYAISKRPVNATANEDGYVLANYASHKDYVAIQTEGNKDKIEQVFADEATVQLICDYLLRTGSSPKRGLCHGSRNGAEVRWFAEKLGVQMVGTDISDTAGQFGLVQWDFHERNPDWVGAFDFIYSNSHDHAYDPAKAFGAWVEQLAPGGKIFIEHTVAHSTNGVSPLDPFGIEPMVVPFAILGISKGRYAVTDIIKPPHKKSGERFFVFVIEPVQAKLQPEQ